MRRGGESTGGQLSRGSEEGAQKRVTVDDRAVLASAARSHQRRTIVQHSQHPPPTDTLNSDCAPMDRHSCTAIPAIGDCTARPSETRADRARRSLADSAEQRNSDDQTIGDERPDPCRAADHCALDAVCWDAHRRLSSERNRAAQERDEQHGRETLCALDPRSSRGSVSPCADAHRTSLADQRLPLRSVPLTVRVPAAPACPLLASAQP